jgi:hypothetical protein
MGSSDFQDSGQLASNHDEIRTTANYVPPCLERWGCFLFGTAAAHSDVGNKGVGATLKNEYDSQNKGKLSF